MQLDGERIGVRNQSVWKTKYNLCSTTGLFDFGHLYRDATDKEATIHERLTSLCIRLVLTLNAPALNIFVAETPVASDLERGQLPSFDEAVDSARMYA
jgi:hypothetical protein